MPSADTPAVQVRRACLVAGFALLISACGGGGGGSQSAGVGGTGISTAQVQGRTTGFGSIFVNGVRFETDTSEFSVDGIPGATQANLSIGMVVTLDVETRDGNYTGKALRVSYDDEIQGPVAATPVDVVGSGGAQKTFQVFGQTITIDETATVFDGIAFDTLDANDVIEISGFRNSPTEVFATYVEFKETLVVGSSEVELRGTVSGYAPPAMQFTLDGQTINFDNSTEIDIDGGLADGVYVEVEGIYQAGPSIFAQEIDEEDDGFGSEAGDVKLQGLVSNFVSLADFEIDGQAIDASAAVLEPANAASLLADGVEVEVRGDISGGVLRAEQLELEDDETRLKAFVSFIYADNERFDVQFNGLAGSIEVVTDTQTLFDDESPANLPNLTVADMNVGDFVSVRGTEANDRLLAETVKRGDATDPDDSELEGRVDSFVADTSITVLGIAFNVDGATQYFDENENPIVPSGNFFTGLTNGDPVQIKDDDPADGIADEVELDD